MKTYQELIQELTITQNPDFESYERVGSGTVSRVTFSVEEGSDRATCHVVRRRTTTNKYVTIEISFDINGTPYGSPSQAIPPVRLLSKIVSGITQTLVEFMEEIDYEETQQVRIVGHANSVQKANIYEKYFSRLRKTHPEIFEKFALERYAAQVALVYGEV